MAYMGKLPPRNFAPDAKSPCEGCTDRAIGCHGTCQKYTDWKDDWLKERKVQNSAYNADKAVNDFLAKTAYRMKKENKNG